MEQVVVVGVEVIIIRVFTIFTTTRATRRHKLPPPQQE